MVFNLLPSVPLDQLCCIHENQFVEDFLSTVVCEKEFLELDTLREQCHYLINKSTENKLKFTIADAANFLNKDYYSIYRQLKKKTNKSPKIGRPSIFSQEILNDMINFILKNFNKGKPSTIGHVYQFLLERYNMDVKKDTILHFINRNPLLKLIRGIPLEDSRFYCNTCLIDQFYDDLESIITEIPSAFVLNLDETGFNEFTDTNPGKSYCAKFL